MRHTDLLDIITARIYALQQQGYTGPVEIRIAMAQGGVRECDLHTTERLTGKGEGRKSGDNPQTIKKDLHIL